MKKLDEIESTNPIIRAIKKLDSIQFGLDEEKEYFVENLSMLLAAGINVTSALSSIKAGMKSDYMKKVVDNLKADIEEGSSLWKAFSKTDLLPEHIIVLFRIGEMTGKLPENLKMINLQQQKERIFRGKIKSAMMYPVLVLALTAVIGIGIAWFILPRLSGVFASLRLDLPLITKILIKVGNFLGAHGTVVIPLFLMALFALIYFVFIYRKTNFIGQWILFRIPGIKDLIQQTELSRLGHILGQLLSVNLPVTDAVDSLKSSTTVLVYQKLYIHMKSQIEVGSSFQQSFNTYPGIDKLIPAPIQQMIASGEQSGCLPKLLKTIGETFEEKTDATAKNLSTILEPLLLLVIWGGVMSVALAVLLPIYSLIGGIGKGPPQRKSNNTQVEKKIEAPKPTAGQKATYPTTQGQPPTGNTAQKNPSSNTAGSEYVELTEDGLQKVDIFEQEAFDRNDWKPIEIKESNGETKMIYSSYEDLESKIDEAQVQIDKKGNIVVPKDKPSQIDLVDTPANVEEETIENESMNQQEIYTPSSEVVITEASIKDDLATKNTIPDQSFVEERPQEDFAKYPETEIQGDGSSSSEIKDSETNQTLIETNTTETEINKTEGDDYVVPAEPLIMKISSESKTALVKVQYNINMLNVRQYPSTGAKILKQIYPGETFPFIEWRDGWYKIFYEEGKSGWVFGTFVEEITE